MGKSSSTYRRQEVFGKERRQANDRIRADDDELKA